MKILIGTVALAALLSAGIAVKGPSAESTPAQPRFAPQTVSVYFPLGESELTPEAGALLDETADSVRERGADRLVVVGYADPSGTEMKNARIAEARADAVQKALIARGIDAGRIQVLFGGVTASTGDPMPPVFIASRRTDITIEPAEPAGF